MMAPITISARRRRQRASLAPVLAALLLTLLAAAAPLAADARSLQGACAANSDCPPATPVCVLASGGGLTAGGLASGGGGPGRCRQCRRNSQCRSDAKPVCDTSSYTCVECAANSDCGGATPFCSAATKTCVACQTNADCATATLGTLQARQCVAGACMQCRTSSQCKLASGARFAAGTTATCTARNTCRLTTAPSPSPSPSPGIKDSGVNGTGVSPKPKPSPPPFLNGTNPNSNSSSGGDGGGGDDGGDGPPPPPPSDAECSANGDCTKKFGPLTDLRRCGAGGACQQCLVDADCASNVGIVDPRKHDLCDAGRCVACRSDSDCSGAASIEGQGPYCEAGKCATRAARGCDSAADCAATYACSLSSCPEPTCEADGVCDSHLPGLDRRRQR